jgi:gliding motility-associated-like protein
MQAFDVPKLQVEDTSACLNGKTALIANLIPNATYSWGTPAITNSSNKFDITVTAPIPSFKVLVVDQNNCKDSTDVQISISPSPIFSLNGLDLCEGETKKLITTLDPLSNIPLSYSWSRNGVPISTSKWEELAYTQAGNYTLKLGIKGCFETKSKVIKANPTPKINMPLVYKHCFETDPSLSLNAEVFKKYTWLSDGNVLDTTQNIKVAPEQDTDYILKVENSFGCKDSTKLLVRKVCAPRLFVPNVITPESDDINSKLRIFGANYTNFEITVFNRWGEVIFHSKDPDNAWTGEYLNSKMPIGNYQWQVKYEGDTEEYRGPYKKTGDVAIIR